MRLIDVSLSITVQWEGEMYTRSSPGNWWMAVGEYLDPVDNYQLLDILETEFIKARSGWNLTIK